MAGLATFRYISIAMGEQFALLVLIQATIRSPSWLVVLCIVQ